MIVLSPEGKAPTTAARVVALPRFPDLRGKVVGLLDNSKPNADKLGERFEQLLREQYGVAGRRNKFSTNWRPRRTSFSAVLEIEARARRGVSTTPSNYRNAAGLP